LKGVAHDREVFQSSLKTYFVMSGWDPKTGEPTVSKHEELGFGWGEPNGNGTA